MQDCEQIQEVEQAILICTGKSNVTSSRLSFAHILSIETKDKYACNYREITAFIQEGINEGIKNIVMALGNKIYDSVLQILYKGGLYGLVNIWILPEYFEDKMIVDVERDCLCVEDYNKPRLESFQVHLTDLCNLNCKGCGHYSNIAKDANFLNLETYKEDLQCLKKLFWGVERIYLLGGEPLLYPNIEEAIEITRGIFSDAEIHVTTNGLLLPNMPDSFFYMVNKTNSHIEISMYPKTYEKKEEIAEILKKHNLEKTTILWGRVEFMKRLLKEKNGTPEKSFETCSEIQNACNLLREGKLAKCPMMLLIDIFDSQYNVKRECRKDYIDLHHDKIDGWQALEQLNTVSEMCNYCAESPVNFEWDMCPRNIAKEEDWYV